MTTAQRDALASQRGIIENTTTGTFQQYIGGAWASIGTDATANGSATVAGKYEEATVAEQGTATATGATGARLVPAVANLVKTSSGAGDENKIVVPQSDGTFAEGFLGTGTPDNTKYLRGDGTWQLTSSFASARVLDIKTANSTAITGGGTSDQDIDLTYTIAANDLVAGVEYEMEAWGIYNGGNLSRQFNPKFKLGSVTLVDFGAGIQGTASTNSPFYLKGSFVCRSTGASGTVMASGELRVATTAGASVTTDTVFQRVKNSGSTVTVDTTASAALKFTQAWNIDDGSGKSVQIHRLRVTRLAV